jgi:hypothetical protein
MAISWIEHILKVRQEADPPISYKEAMKLAAKSYTKAPRKVKVRGPPKPNAWMEHIKAFKQANPEWKKEFTYKQLLTKCTETYTRTTPVRVKKAKEVVVVKIEKEDVTMSEPKKEEKQEGDESSKPKKKTKKKRKKRIPVEDLDDDQVKTKKRKRSVKDKKSPVVEDEDA